MIPLKEGYPYWKKIIMVSKYYPNFVSSKQGNILRSGQNLIIKINGNPSYILGRLFYRKRFGRKKLIQIEQTGSPSNSKRTQIKFEMLRYTKNILEEMPKGKYSVSTYAYFPGIGGKRWDDNFEIS